MQKEHGKKGLVIVLVTNNPASRMESFLKQKGANNLAVAIGGGMASTYGVRGIPDAYLLDTTGTVIWQGHPGGGRWDSYALEALKKTSGLRIEAGDYSSKFRSSIKKLEQKKYKSAISSIKRLARGSTKEDAEKLLGKIKEFATGMLKQSKEMANDKDYYAALANYKMIEKNFSAFKDIVSEARSARKEMESDKEIKKELEAGKKLAKAGKYEERGKYSSFVTAYKTYRSITKRYAGTAAAEKAKELMNDIKKRGEFNYNRRCSSCRRMGRACPECKRK